jgi:ubiquinone/menaquinone biosynthesis C-methylase UbiE
MDHLERTRKEFTRQAAQFSRASATTDPAHVARLVDAIGSAVHGRILDVACGPGIVTSALAAVAREVGALDLTPEMVAKAEERCAAAGHTNVLFKQGPRPISPLRVAALTPWLRGYRFIIFSNPKKVLLEMLRVLKVEAP